MTGLKLLSCLSLGVALAMPMSAMGAIGEIFYTEGRVQVKRADQQVDAGRGYALESGDVILTGANSQARMRLNDESYFALPANTTFKIDQFAVSAAGRKRQPSTAIFSLLRGGFRTVSGLVGSWSKDTYKVNTPVVTMGIRGTEYSVLVCNTGSCPGAPDGGFIEVLDGSVNASNTQGAVSLDAGQWGEVRSPPAQVLVRPLAFVLDKSGIFDPSKPITAVSVTITTPGILPDIRIEGEVRVEPPASPSAPPQQ